MKTYNSCDFKIMFNELNKKVFFEIGVLSFVVELGQLNIVEDLTNNNYYIRFHDITKAPERLPLKSLNECLEIAQFLGLYIYNIDHKHGTLHRATQKEIEVIEVPKLTALTASEFVKNAGLKKLKEVEEMTGQSTQTLNNWFNNKRKLFEIVLLGCCEVIKQKSKDNDK